jgi:hypothetical protein
VGGETYRAEARLQKGGTAMEPQTTTPPSSLSPMWERLETFVREPIQGCIQTRGEEEGPTRWGRPQSARRAAMDASKGRRHGYGHPRR